MNLTFAWHAKRTIWLFLLFATAVIGASVTISVLLPSLPRPEMMAVGVTVDLVVMLPLAYYFLVIRRHNISGISVIPAIIVGYVVAKIFLPSQFAGHLPILEWMLVPLEFGLLGVIAYKTYRAIQRVRETDLKGSLIETDVVESIRETCREFFKQPVVAKLAAYEISIFYFALVSWWTVSPRPARKLGPGRFSCYRESGYGAIFVGLLIVLLIETVAVHVLLSWYVSSLLAWILSAFSVYATLWLLGDYQAMRLRPTVIDDTCLRLRFGLRLEATIRADLIRDIQKVHEVQRPLARTTLNGSLLDQPTIRLDLVEPIETHGFYGLKKMADRIYLSIDERPRFVAACEALKSAAGPSCENSTCKTEPN